MNSTNKSEWVHDVSGKCMNLIKFCARKRCNLVDENTTIKLSTEDDYLQIQNHDKCLKVPNQVINHIET